MKDPSRKGRQVAVDHFSTRTGGGAGAGARRLHEALLAAGVDSQFWYWRRGKPVPDNAHRVVLWGGGGLLPRIVRRLHGRVKRRAIKAEVSAARRGAPRGLELFTAPFVGWSTEFDPRRFQGDVAHLHWVAGLIDHPSFFRSLPLGHPVVWTLRDMNPFTGGCHFSGGCQQFVDGCGSCPQLGASGPDDLSHRFLAVKAAALEKANLHVVAPSRWMLAQARRSPVFGGARGFTRIPIGIETRVFVPHAKDAARADLGLPSDRAIVAIGAERLDNVRKGLLQGMAALARLKTERPILLLCFGGELPTEQVPAGLDVHSMGYIRDTSVQARVYAAADCFLLPSMEDNLPKTGLEALACGTPVVAFAAGGIPDYVIPGKTGLLAKTGDVDELGTHLATVLENPERRLEMGRAGRELILAEFTARGQAEAYRALYERLVSPPS